jgi:hypothetical protein
MKQWYELLLRIQKKIVKKNASNTIVLEIRNGKGLGFKGF